MAEQHPEPITEPQRSESNTKTAGERIRALRKARKLTQSGLAAITGINIRQIQKVESGESAPGNLTAKNLLALADALGVDPHELI